MAIRTTVTESRPKSSTSRVARLWPTARYWWLGNRFASPAGCIVDTTAWAIRSKPTLLHVPSMENRLAAGAVARLYKIEYRDAEPAETEIDSWQLSTDENGQVSLNVAASEPGQYRLACRSTMEQVTPVKGLRCLP